MADGLETRFLTVLSACRCAAPGPAERACVGQASGGSLTSGGGSGWRSGPSYTLTSLRRRRWTNGRLNIAQSDPASGPVVKIVLPPAAGIHQGGKAGTICPHNLKRRSF